MIDHIEFTVIGTPAPQGSKRFLGVHGGKGIMVESSKAVKPWREAVKYAAIDATSSKEGYSTAWTIIGPVLLDIKFTFQRPKSTKATALHGVKPDLSKLIRSTEDAITDARLWEDDSRVVTIITSKFYTGHPYAMPLPGALISIRRAS